MGVKAADIATLVELFETSGWDELHVEIEGLQLFLSTDPAARLVSGAAQAAQAPAVAPAAPRASAARVDMAATAATGSTPTAAAPPDHWVAVAAPNLGTFYRAPKPGAAPYVEPGQRVEADTEICLLEVMKLFTAVKAGVAGTVKQVCVADGEMVEFGQPLFFVEPA